MEARPALLNGTWMVSTLADNLNNSLARWLAVPLPAEPKAYLPGSFLNKAINSGSVFAGTLALTAMMLG